MFRDKSRAAESFASNIEEDSDLDIGIFDDASRAFAFLDVRDLGLGALADA